MSRTEIIGLIITLLSLAGSLETFGGVAFSWKLIATGIAAVTVLWLVAGRLARWVRPSHSPGFGPTGPSTPYGRHVVSIIVLVVVSASFVGGAWLIVLFYTLNVEENPISNDQFEFWLRAPVQVAEKLTVHLPSRTKAACDPIEPQAREQADVTLVDFNTLNPQLQISNFSHPQRQGLRCRPRIDPDDIKVRVAPPTIEIFFPGDRLRYLVGIISTGGVLWILGIVLLSCFSRRRQ